MKRILWILLIVLASGYVFGQEQAVLREFSGKVEVMPPGKNWEPAARNLVLPTGTIISTGFNSYATVQVGSANLQVKPLTRMAISELVQAQGSQKTTLNLRVGRVHAKVEKVEGLEHDFALKSPVSTAAVRGTEFEYSGTRLQVMEGLVRFSNALNQSRSIRQGESSQIQGYSSPSTPEQSLIVTSQTVISTAPEREGARTGTNASLGGSLKVTVK
jgi:hypothetical protein